MSNFPSRRADPKTEKYVRPAAFAGRADAFVARESTHDRVVVVLHEGESNGETIWKTARRVHCCATILHGDPVSFICSLNSK